MNTKLEQHSDNFDQEEVSFWSPKCKFKFYNHYEKRQSNF